MQEAAKKKHNMVIVDEEITGRLLRNTAAVIDADGAFRTQEPHSGTP